VKPAVLRRNCLIEATVALTLARLAVSLLPAAWIVAWAKRSPRRVDRFLPPAIIDAVCRAVDEVGAKPWMQALCLPRALAAQAMLRRRGVGSRLCLGAGRDNGALAAHAWIELDYPLPVPVGASGQQQFIRLVSFG
jgi:hypothetical protein